MQDFLASTTTTYMVIIMDIVATTPATSWGYKGTPCTYYDRTVRHPLQGQLTQYSVGETFIKGDLRQGNHVDVLPYHWTKLEQTLKSGVIEWNSNGFNGACRGVKGKNTEMYQASTDGWLARSYATPTISQKDRLAVQNAALLKAHADARKQLMSIPMLLKERAQTVKSVKFISKGILNNAITMQRKDVKEWIKAVKRYKKRPEQLKKIANDIASKHLEFVFGILPLLDEIKGAATFLQQEERDFFIANGRHTTISERDQIDHYQYASVLHKLRSRYSVRTFLRYNVTLQMGSDLRHLGFNPLYTWYDFTPLSFLVGWFSNLNTFIEALDPLVGVKYQTGGYTARMETSDTRSMIRKPDKNNYVCTIFESGEGFTLLTDQTRTPYPREPGLPMPQFIDNYGFFAATASLSLVIQRFVKTANVEIGRKPFKYRGRKPRYLPPITYRK